MGRQPTSGYCLTCRKRRVKCDRSRPTCERCRKSGHLCRGYETLRMKNYTILGTHQMAKLPTTAGERPVQELPTELSLVAFQDNMAFSYFFASFGWAPFWRPLLRLATADDAFPSANRTCSLAIATGYMGNCERVGSLQAQGRGLYGQTLREVRVLLEENDKEKLAWLTITVIIMGMYSFAVDNGMGKVHHVGTEQLVRHCGPEIFQTEDLLTVYRSCRMLLICQAMGHQSRSFMEEKAWKTVPWKYLPKTSEDQLVDILADLPGLAEDVTDSRKQLEVKKKVEVLLKQIKEWRANWQDNNPKAARTVSSQHLGTEEIQNPLLEEILSTKLTFESLSQGLEILLYNATLLYIMQLDDMAQSGTPRVPKSLSTEDLEYIRSVSSAGREEPLLLPREVRYQCQPAIEGFRVVPFISHELSVASDRTKTLVSLIPLGIVYWCLQGQPELGGYVDGVLESLPVFRNATRVFAGYRVSGTHRYLTD